MTDFHISSTGESRLANYRMDVRLKRETVDVRDGGCRSDGDVVSEPMQFPAGRNRRAMPKISPFRAKDRNAPLNGDLKNNPQKNKMSEFIQERHKLATRLLQPRELIVACVPMRSNVNISQIARTASACAVEKMIVCGNASLTKKIARDASSELLLSIHRSLAPVLKKLKLDGYRIVGIEQTSNSQNIHHFAFHRRTVLVVGNERLGISEDILTLLDDVIEIPVWGLPHSYNAASATNMALYEFCRQFPEG